MKEVDFRTKYCELMEFYQYVEMRLKYICAALLADEEKGWFERLGDYESDPFGMSLQKIKEYQKQKQITMLSEDDIMALDAIRVRRNYWVHQCFSNPMHVIFRRGELRDQVYAKDIISDLDDAIEWDEKLTEVMRKHKIQYI